MLDTFNGGYTKALLDVQNFFSNHSDSLKFCKLYNQKGVMKVLSALIEHREELRTTGDAVLKYNMDRKEFTHDKH